MRVIATARGFDGQQTREVDEEFEMPDGAKGSWFNEVGGAPAPAAKPAKVKAEKPAKTLSEHAAQNPEPLA